MYPSLAVVFLVLALGQFLSVTVVEAIQCYACFNCGDPFKPDGISVTTCETSCLKAKGKKGSTEVVGRYCGRSNKSQCTEGTYEDLSGTICTCTSDKCNTAATTKSPKLLFGTLGAAWLIVKRL